MKTDIQIASETALHPITKIADKLGIPASNVYQYGANKCKINYNLLDKLPANPNNRLVLLTAINPTPAGEGKTTVSISLADALSRLGKKTALALREPSLGPVFGIKGGATGGGYAQIAPMDEINLHFTGDLHAITTANNLLASLIDNSVFQGNPLNIDTRRIVWKRCLDLNDRQLRAVADGLGGRLNGNPREDGFDITAASEIMAVFCLANSFDDLRTRLDGIVVAYNYDNEPVKVKDLGVVGALLAVLKDAFNPNLVQTLEGTPAFVHGGPFANIAHGCNSVLATKLAMRLSDWTVTEAGFGADLGAEKFIDIKCRTAGLSPDAIVLVATVRALKYNGGVKKDAFSTENLRALEVGTANLARHIHNLRDIFGANVTIAINRFATDTPAELALLEKFCAENGVNCAVSDGFAKGSVGAVKLAETVIESVESEPKRAINFSYELDAPIVAKVEKIAKRIYGAKEVQFTATALTQIKKLEADGYAKLPVCIAKTQYSFTDDQTKLGAPTDFTFTIREVKVSAGAGFIVAISGAIMTMPGLPKHPAALDIDVRDGEVVGLF